MQGQEQQICLISYFEFDTGEENDEVDTVVASRESPIAAQEEFFKDRSADELFSSS